uniref:Uncharacterized protein n=1 Tax=Kalanchoe fedtschenkoi TaxID=63787 RepID=A0A7N1A7G5_KALFE
MDHTYIFNAWSLKIEFNRSHVDSYFMACSLNAKTEVPRQHSFHYQCGPCNLCDAAHLGSEKMIESITCISMLLLPWAVEGAQYFHHPFTIHILSNGACSIIRLVILVVSLAPFISNIIFCSSYSSPLSVVLLFKSIIHHEVLLSYATALPTGTWPVLSHKCYSFAFHK